MVVIGQLLCALNQKYLKQQKLQVLLDSIVLGQHQHLVI